MKFILSHTVHGDTEATSTFMQESKRKLCRSGNLCSYGELIHKHTGYDFAHVGSAAQPQRLYESRLHESAALYIWGVTAV